MVDQYKEQWGFAADSLKPVYEYLRIGAELPRYEHVDWRHAPAQWKPYNACDCISLSYTSLAAQAISDPCAPAQLGQMLANIYGLTRQRWTSTEAYNAAAAGSTMPILDPAQRSFRQELLRPVPSGGGLFPCELYLAMGDEQTLPSGIYHYDALHHALDCINCAAHLSAIIAALAPMQYKGGEPLYALVFSCSFQKSAFKYGEFGYRLQGLDVGIVVAQCLEVLLSMHLQGHVQFQFFDKTINHLLGLDTLIESAYVVVLVTPEEQSKSLPVQASSEPILSWHKPAARREQPLQSISCWPVSAQLHQSSLWCNQTDFVSSASITQPEPRGQPVALKQAPMLHLFQGSAQRHSARHFFIPGEIQEEALSAMLEAAGRGYTSDLIDSSTARSSQIYCVVNAVTGVLPGVYCYQKETAQLLLQREEDMRPYLQKLVEKIGYNNVYHISVYIFLIGNSADGFSAYGNRWYRMQHFDAGIAIQRMYLAAAILGLGCDTTLAYPVTGVDRLLQLPTGYSTLAQVMVAPERIAGQYYESLTGPGLRKCGPKQTEERFYEG